MIGSAPFFFQRVLREHRVDLFVAHRAPAGTKVGRDRARIVLGRVDHGDQDLDDALWLHSRPGSLRGFGRRSGQRAASLLQLRRRPLGVRVQVDVHRLDLLAPERVRLDQAAEGVVHAQPQDPLQFLVCPAGGRLADQHDDGGPQRAVRREPDVAETPEPVHVERRDAAQRVVAARMAVAGQVAQSVQGAIHGATRGAQRSTHLAEHDDRLAVKEPLQGVDLRISRSVCHYYDYS